MCALRVTWHTSIRYSSSCHTRVNILMHVTYLEAVGIHRIQRDLVVNRFSIHVTSSACTQNEN